MSWIDGSESASGFQLCASPQKTRVLKRCQKNRRVEVKNEPKNIQRFWSLLLRARLTKVTYKFLHQSQLPTGSLASRGVKGSKAAVVKKGHQENTHSSFCWRNVDNNKCPISREILARKLFIPGSGIECKGNNKLSARKTRYMLRIAVR